MYGYELAYYAQFHSIIKQYDIEGGLDHLGKLEVARCFLSFE